MLSLFLDKKPRWQPGGPDWALLYQKMCWACEGSWPEGIPPWDPPGPLTATPEMSPWVGVSAMGLLTPEMMLEEILVLYQEVYRLRSDLGEVQYSAGVAEDTHIEILEVLKACLQHTARFLPTRWAQTDPQNVGRGQVSGSNMGDLWLL